LCVECDNELGRFDDYAAKVLKPWPKRSDLFRGDDGFIARDQETKYLGYWIRNPNVDLLQSFASSLLWRAAITNRPEMYIEVEPAIRERARRVFEHGDEGSYFDIILMRLPRGVLSDFVARPVLKHGAYSPGFEFCMRGLVLVILVRHPERSAAAPFLLGRTKDWFVGFVPFWGSRYEEAMRDMINIHR
jgi:hypothetical protein